MSQSSEGKLDTEEFRHLVQKIRVAKQLRDRSNYSEEKIQSILDLY